MDLRRHAVELASATLTDDDAEDIRQAIAAGVRGPVLLKWLEQLLQDRDSWQRRPRGELTERSDE